MVKNQIDELPANAAEYKQGLRKWLPMVVLSLALMIIVIDTTVLNVSLKVIANDLHTNLQGLQWVITAYALTLAALTITGGRLGDLFGRKRMFMLGAIIFAIGSFITSLSHSVGMMISGEAVVEGIGAALMMPATASLLVANYKGRDRAIAFGIWGGIAAASSAIGPLVGGFLTTHYSWRWAFRINVFIALILLAGSLIIAESRDRAEKRELDFLGVGLSAAGLLLFVYGIIESSTYGWWRAKQAFQAFGMHVPGSLSPTPFALIAGALILAAFAWWQQHIESRGHTPLVSLRLFKNAQFAVGSSVIAMLSLGMTGLVFAIPVFLQSVRNLDALHTGLALLPMSATMLVVAPSSAALSKYITPKRLIQAGLVLAAIASVILHFSITATATPASFIPGMIVFGMGMGLVMAQASNMTLSAVSVEQAGEASGVNNTLRQVGASFGSAIIGSVLLATLASSLVSGINSSTVIPSQMKPQVSSAVATQAASVELGGVSQQETSRLPQDTQTELTSIVHRASAKASSTSILYTGFFITVGFGISFFLPNRKDLEKNESVAVAGH
jgi:EmrB/QacA subfamily drug resistance transporter